MLPVTLLASSLAHAAPHALTASRGPLVEVPESDGMACDDFYTPRASRIVRTTASSALVDGAVTHSADHAIDGNPQTAWVEGVEGDGIGEALVFELSGVDEVPIGLEITPGYAKDERRWTSNNRVSVVSVRFLGPKDEGVERPATGWKREDLEAIDVFDLTITLAQDGGRVPMGPQHVDFASVFDQDMRVTEVVAAEVRIAAVDSVGAQYHDTCVSEVRLVVADRTRRLRRACAPGWCEQYPNVTDGCPR